MLIASLMCCSMRVLLGILEACGAYPREVMYLRHWEKAAKLCRCMLGGPCVCRNTPPYCGAASRNRAYLTAKLSLDSCAAMGGAGAEHAAEHGGGACARAEGGAGAGQHARLGALATRAVLRHWLLLRPPHAVPLPQPAAVQRVLPLHPDPAASPGAPAAMTCSQRAALAGRCAQQEL